MEILRNPTVIWCVIGLVMFLLEMAGPGMVILFFGIGAWIVMLLTIFLDLSLNGQLAVFLLASAVSLILFRRILQKAFHGHEADEQDLAKEMDEFTGHKAMVVQKIAPGTDGKVEFNGSQWEAESGEEIEAGETVQIVSKDNLTLKVKKI